MSEQNLSQWFLLSEQTPWEVGVYEVNSGNEWNHITYSSYWCGSKFHGGWGFPEEAYENKDHPGDGSGSKWRGLSTSPEVKKKPQNKRKTMYVVMNAVTNNPTASFFSVNSARDYAETVNFPVRVKKIRFRTTE